MRAGTSAVNHRAVLDGGRRVFVKTMRPDQAEAEVRAATRLACFARSRSAVRIRVWPHDAPSNPPLQLNLRVRTGLANAGLVLPEATETYFPHVSAAYGKVDTHYLKQMNRADALASALLGRARHHETVRVNSVRLVMETQHPDCHTYTFERIQELPLGR
ncbi:hypothetical protein [Streptomyces sp. NPDC058683]|uniref:hypothetical protein n=1 Tax=Streptomyces sp. NPDC058683 TaxID=3346597 RepID=UPI0036472A7C